MAGKKNRSNRTATHNFSDTPVQDSASVARTFNTAPVSDIPPETSPAIALGAMPAPIASEPARRGAIAPSAMPASSVTPGRRTSSALRDTQYQKKAQELNELVNNLRTTGAQFLLDLPTVVVCGNQSAGKSSVIEGLSGITLPRSSGTCTRCPMEVRMSSAGKFSCSLKLRREFDDSTGGSLGTIKEESFGKAVTEEEEVELAIRRAQKAILNPSRPTSIFEQWVGDSDSDSNELQFTKNVVVVEITGGPADLTLIDLPGIIRSTEHEEDARYITLIQDLVKAYIQKSNTIIVPTVTCTDDIDNQEVIKLAKEADPQMQRTLGVLTKPDRIAEGEEKQWLPVLQGTKYVLNLGWYMVKNPTQKELDDGVSFEAAREQEGKFFASSDTWRLVGETGRLGTAALRQSLSRQLVELIKLKLPGMLEVIQSNLDTMEAEYKTLPLVVEDPVVEFAMLANQLRDELQAIVTASQACDPEGRATFHQLKAVLSQFQQAIIATQPVFVFDNGLTVVCNPDGTDLVYAKDEAEWDFLHKLFGLEGKVENFLQDRRLMSIKHVHQVIAQEAGVELPGCTAYGATVALVQHFQECWEDLAEECFGEVDRLLLHCATKKMDEVLKRFPEMLMACRGVLHDMYTPLAERVLGKVRELTDEEKLLPPFTLNEHYLQESRVKFLDKLLKVWWEQNNSHLSPEDRAGLQEALERLKTVKGFTVQQVDDLFRTLDIGRDGQALELMATAMAYLKVAARRYGDTVPMKLLGSLVSKFPKLLHKELLRLMVMEMEQLPKLMEEDGQVAARRSLLQGHLKCLKHARSRLTHFA